MKRGVHDKKIVIKTGAVIFVSLIKSSSLNLLFFWFEINELLSLKTKNNPIKQASRIFFEPTSQKIRRLKLVLVFKSTQSPPSKIKWTKKIAGQKTNGTQVDVQK
jgi:hypothetical protein